MASNADICPIRSNRRRILVASTSTSSGPANAPSASTSSAHCPDALHPQLRQPAPKHRQQRSRPVRVTHFQDERRRNASASGFLAPTNAPQPRVGGVLPSDSFQLDAKEVLYGLAFIGSTRCKSVEYLFRDVVNGDLHWHAAHLAINGGIAQHPPPMPSSHLAAGKMRLMAGKHAACMADHYTYRITWSAEDRARLGLCAEFPSLSWTARGKS